MIYLLDWGHLRGKEESWETTEANGRNPCNNEAGTVHSSTVTGTA